MSSGATLELNVGATPTPAALAPLSEQASAHLNMLRGIAAFVVLLGHWRSIFFVDWPQVRHHNLLLGLFYWSSKFGHEAVVVFFVLSGYLIGRTVLRPVWSGKWSAKHYALHRLIRLEIVLFPALCLCWLWDSAGIHLFSPSPTYLGTGGSSVLAYNIPSWINAHIFFGNLVFLQTLLVPPFGSDNPLWSLANEFWYYALFPCLVIALTARFSWLRRAIATLVMIAISVFIGKWMLGGYLIWLLGVLLIFLPKPVGLKNRHRSLLLLASLVCIAMQLVLTTAAGKPERQINTDYVLAILVTVLLYTLLHDPRPVSKLYKKFAAKIAGFSYTLYLTHLPVLVFFSAWINYRHQPSPEGFALPLGILCLTVAYSYGIAMIFEHNTDRVRKRLETIFGA
ncbi:MAG: acyltransferase family protein [Acidobacteriaceae bacterium]